MTAPTLNGMRVIRTRLLQLWKGAWLAELELDVDVVATAPTSGPAILVLGGTTLTGTIDPRGSGTFDNKAAVRVVGGRGAWDQTVPHQDFFSDGGVLSTTVYQQTGALIGEVVVDELPTLLAPHVERSSGPARRVFGALDWWVDLTGVTHVGSRLPAIPDTSLVIRDFDPLVQRVEFSCDALLIPGTPLVDTRFNAATPIVRDVEQIFDEHGSTGFAWCSAKAVSRLTSALENLIVEAAGRTFVRAYRYRFVIDQGSRVALQAVNPVGEVPDIVPIAPWSGLAGASNELAPSQEVFVAFDFTTPGSPQPIIVGYSLQGLPFKTKVDASLEVDIGPSALKVVLAGGVIPVALATPLTTFLTALQTWSGAVSGALSAAGFAITAPQGTLVSAITAAKAATPAQKTVAA